jgi:hypothetical protein
VQLGYFVSSGSLIVFARPRQIFIVTKPDDRLISKARLLAEYFTTKFFELTESEIDGSASQLYTASPAIPSDCLRHTCSDSNLQDFKDQQVTPVTVYIQDIVLEHPSFQGPTPLAHPCIQSWNADALRHQTLSPCSPNYFEFSMDAINPKDISQIVKNGIGTLPNQA